MKSVPDRKAAKPQPPATEQLERQEGHTWERLYEQLAFEAG